MARRLSRLSQSCAAGLSYIAAASSLIAAENYLNPSSIVFGQPPHTHGTGLGAHVAESHQDLSAGIKYHLLSTVGHSPVKSADFDNVALPAAQRVFTGGDRFEQSWSAAIDLLGQLHAKHRDTADSVDLLADILLRVNRVTQHNSPGETSPLTVPNVTARVALSLIPDYNAHDLLANSLLEIAQHADNAKLRQGLLIEARQQYAKNSNSLAALSLDLSMASPILSHAIFSLTTQLQRLDAPSTHLIAQIISDMSCNESWSLMSNVVRKYLWYHANKHALKNASRSARISDEVLSEMARAGIEEAEWSLSVRLKDKQEEFMRRVDLLSFSAHKGRAVAQLELAKLAGQGRISLYPTTPRAASAEPEAEEDAVLDSWDPVDYPVKLSTDEYANSHLQLITDTITRWEGYDNRGSSFVSAYTEALLTQAWNAFFGKGVPRSLRDCLIVLNKVPSTLVKYTYLWIFQLLMIANGLLNKLF